MATAPLKKTAVLTTRQKLPGCYKLKITAGITKAAKKWNVALDKGLVLDEFKYQGKNTTRLGNRPIADNTKTNYEGHYRQLWRYCAFIGDFESMLLLLSPAPKHVPAMNVTTVESFLRFKRLPTGTVLLTTDESSAVTDVFKNPMTCEGSWIARGNSDIYRAGISVLHVHHNHTTEYLEPCDDCRARSVATLHRGCSLHPGSPCTRRKGNPTRYVIFINSLSSLNDKSHKETGSSQLLPSDERLLRNHLLSSRTLVSLQTWVIMIIAIRLFLRHDEFHSIRFERFLAEFFVITDNRVESLALQVSDEIWRKLKLYADHVYPELCPVRPLLVYTHLIGIKGGFLFPKASELAKPPADDESIDAS